MENQSSAVRSYIGNYASRPLEFVRGEGSYLFDKEGRRYVDLLGGWCTSTVGWRNPEMARAIARQAEEGIYVPPVFASGRQEALAKRLLGLAPGNMSRVFRTTSGSEAVEYAVMCVRGATGRNTIVSIDGVYHGRTYGAAALGNAYVDKMGPKPRGFRKLPLPKTHEGGLAVIAEFERIVRETGDVAAFMSEPLWTSPGCHAPPGGFYEGIQRVCRENGVLIAMDEVSTGMGRSGKMFASELQGLEPDVICVGKSFTGGYAAMGATLVTEEVYAAAKGIPDYSTFGWLPQDLAAAEMNVEILLRDRLIENARTMGEYMKESLRSLERLKIVKEVRGQGLMLCVEFVEPIAVQKSIECVGAGLITAPAEDMRSLFLSPPLCIDRASMDEGIEIIKKVCDGAA